MSGAAARCGFVILRNSTNISHSTSRRSLKTANSIKGEEAIPSMSN